MVFQKYSAMLVCHFENKKCNILKRGKCIIAQAFRCVTLFSPKTQSVINVLVINILCVTHAPNFQPLGPIPAMNYSIKYIQCIKLNEQILGFHKPSSTVKHIFCSKHQMLLFWQMRDGAYQLLHTQVGVLEGKKMKTS